MSLNFTLPAPVERFYEEVGKDKYRLRPDVEAVILSTMSTSIGRLKTEDDAREHYTRALLISRLNGHTEEWFPLATALELIGLSTNVFPKEPFKKWAARQAEYAAQEVDYRIRREVKA